MYFKIKIDQGCLSGLWSRTTPWSISLKLSGCKILFKTKAPERALIFWWWQSIKIIQDNYKCIKKNHKFKTRAKEKGNIINKTEWIYIETSTSAQTFCQAGGSPCVTRYTSHASTRRWTSLAIRSTRNYKRGDRRKYINIMIEREFYFMNS